MSSNKNLQSIFLYSFKIMFVIISFNFLVMLPMSRLVFNKFYFSSQNEIFSNIYNKIEEIKELDISSNEFKEIINACRYSNCSIEVYDSSENRRLYSPYVYQSDIFASVDSKQIFDEIIGDESDAIIINGINDDLDAQQAINTLNGLDNAYSLLMRYSDDIYILIQTSTVTRNDYQKMLTKIILWCLSISFILGLFLSYFLAKNMVNSIVSIKNVAKKITQHDFSERCDNKIFNEFFELGNYINEMADSLKHQMDAIESQNLILEEDIKRREKLEMSQKEFISNVSHELKTPISIISGYAEGIRYGLVESEQDKEKYCETIINECDRMRNIVKQLLTLSKLENISLDIQIHDVSEMLKILVEDFSVSNPSRKILYDEKGNFIARYDYDEINRVLRNYIENAIKYSEDEIEVKAYENDDFVHIGIISTGNIDEKDKDRIWERFYRADKSHKRKENSTGLGLSIVKAIMEMHEMPYGVYANGGEIEFFIELRK